MTRDQPAARKLTAREVTRRYGAFTALNGVSIDVAAGECMALVGASGSGKTTLLRCFNRLVEPDGGTVTVGDVDVTTLDPMALRRSMGYVPQDGGLLPHWSVRRNVATVPWLLGKPDALTAADEALTLVGMDPGVYGARWPRELSGGQRQRVALARALAARPGVVLLDEPFGALDAITRGELVESFGALRRRLALTTLLVTHDLHEAALLADRVAVLRGGHIEQVGTMATLVAAPATEYVGQLLSRAGVA